METAHSFNIDFNVTVELKPIFQTSFLQTRYNDIEINGCCYDKENNDISKCCDEDAEFWSVYLHDVNGGRDCIADCKTLGAAHQLEKLLLIVLYTNLQNKSQLEENILFSAVDEAYYAFLKEDETILKRPETEDTGHPFTNCTNICKWLKKSYFPQAIIMSYSIENNPAVTIGVKEGGHDFLFINERYIVDFWFRHVMAVHDASIIIDTMEIANNDWKRKYGSPNKWKTRSI